MLKSHPVRRTRLQYELHARWSDQANVCISNRINRLKFQCQNTVLVYCVGIEISMLEPTLYRLFCSKILSSSDLIIPAHFIAYNVITSISGGWQWQTKYGNKCGHIITAPCTILHYHFYIAAADIYFSKPDLQLLM